MADQESALTLPKSNLLSADIPDRVWELVYFDKKFYLTDENRAEFLQKLADGNIVVQIEGLTLTSKFVYMYQFKNKPVKVEYEQVDKNTLRAK
jgi:hypothetical protein